MLVLALLLTATPSDNFAYDFTERKGEMRVVVRAIGPLHPDRPVVGRFAIVGRNIEIQSLANGNIFANWGCGSDCLNSALYSPGGVKLANLSFPVLSTDGRFALDRTPVNLDPGDVLVSVVDLSTGKREAPVLYPGLYQCNDAKASATEVTLSKCPHGAVVSIPFAVNGVPSKPPRR